MSTKKSDFNIPESQDKSKNKTKKTPATLDDVVKAVDKVSKNISDIPSDIKSTITKNNKDQEQITNGKLKTITDKISEQNKNIQNLIKEINKIKSSGTSSSKGTSTNKNDNTKSSNFRDLSKEEQQRLNREQEYQKKLDAHEKKVAEIAKINAQTTQIQEVTAKSYELFLTQNKKALDDLVFFNKKSDLEISKKTEELKYISEKNAKSLLEMEAESQRKNDKHNAWKEDREYFFGKTNKKAKNTKTNDFIKSVKDFFTLNNKNIDDRTNSVNDNDKTNNLSASDIIKVEVVKLPIENLSSLNVSNSQNASNDNKDNSFTSIAKNFQDRLSEIENKILEGAKSNNKDNQKLILTQAKIDKQLQDNTAARIKAETDNSIKLAKESREKQKFEIDTKLKQQTLDQNKRKFDIDEQDKLFKMARDLEKHTAWQEDRAYDLEKREKADKEAYKDSYKESTTYRAIDSVKNAHSGFGTSVAMSALTGGFINPAVINALKLDKLMMAPLEAFGKSLLRSKKKESGNYTTTSAIKNSKNVDIIREMHVLGGKLDKIAEPKEVGTTEKKKKGLFEKLGDLFGSLGGLASGLGVAGIAMLIKHLFPKTMKALNDKFMGFLTDKVGLSENTAQGVDQLVTDALPGAIAGFTVGGFKGALIGAGLSMAGMFIKHKWDEWHGDANKDERPAKIGPFDANTVQAVLSGAIIGGAFGLKGAAWGAAIGLGAQLISGIVENWRNTTSNEKGEQEAKIEDLGFGEAGKFVLTGAILGSPFGIKGALIGSALGLGALAITKIKEHWDQWTNQGENNTISEIDNLGFGTASSIVLSGAILGGTLGGIKGALIGAAVGLAADVILDNVNTFKQLQNNDLSGMDRAKKTGKLILEDAIMGASLGALGGPMGMLIGAVVGAGVGVIEGIAANWDVIKAAFTSFTNTISEAWQKVSDTYEKDGVIGVIKLIFGGIWNGAKNLAKEAWNSMTGNNEESNNQSSSPAVTEAIKEEYNKDINIENNTKGIVVKEEKIKQNEALAKNVAVNTNDSLININAESDNNLLKDTIFNTQKPMGLTETIEAQVNGNIQDNKAEEQAKGIAEKTNENIATVKKEKQDNISVSTPDEGGIQGSEEVKSSVESSSGNNYKTEIVNGIPAVPMKDLGLKGTIVQGVNSKPYVAPNSVENLKKLDSTIDSWGYDILYTSAMGGSHAGGPRSHAAGQKVDLQLKKNGNSTRMTPGQEQALISAGFARNGTGALGWEPVAGQVLGGHYDYSVGGGQKNNVTYNASEDNTNNNFSTNFASNTASTFSSGISDFYNILGVMAGGDSYSSSTGSTEKLDTMPSTESTNSAVNMASNGSSASSMSSNASKEVQKLDTATIPSTEMANTNELAQLNNSISGNGNSGSDSLANIMTNVAENTANASQNNSAPIIYNNTTTQSSDNDDSVYPVGDLAKTLLYA